MGEYSYVACDLGAESGRVLLGTLAEDRLRLEEIHRFPNGPISIGGTLRWDVLRIFEGLKLGLKMAAGRGIPIAGISCDSWGVDYVLLSGDEPMLTLPYHYRDPRTDGGLERAFAVVPADEIFQETGIQFMAINTLYQLQADLQTRPEILNLADRFLNIGDYFNYLLSGCCKRNAQRQSNVT
jgi:rhamnulokinase